ncbi:magnesium transporter MRS2-1-like isoform X1 [Papaver somniferum]|uniref:magnesium transporter MRS2-1-like isoform X1 n=1 Tax=Papaver somniferum TaxID=3469 RepID=UPI000E6F4E9B|nr:magnesium transporter MRS2-1-like isoform X1 [Papaver somniferum]
MADLKERLLPPRPISSINLREATSRPISSINLREATSRPSASGRPLFQGIDFLGLKKRGQGLRSWIRVDSSGNSQIMEVDKFTMMRRCDLPARDLRLLDPLFVYPSTILGREKAIVVNLEQIRCIITADEVLLLNSLDSYVLQYVVELQRRLTSPGVGEVWRNEGPDLGRRRSGSRSFDNMFPTASPDYLPFEFRALEVALEAACTYLDAQAAELEIEAYPLLDELTSKISTLNLERVRRLKSRLVALTRRVQKVRDEIEQLMDDDGDMAEMYLTEKKRRMEASFYGDQSVMGYSSTGGGLSVSAPVSPVSSPPDNRKLEKSLSIARSRHESMKSSESTSDNIEELEMLLEAYFVVIDSTLNKLTSLKEYIDDTEDFINIQLDNVRNQLIQFELLLTTATFVVAIFGVVAGVFGMNFTVPLFDQPDAFKWVLVITGICGLIIFASFLWFFKYKRLMPL